MRAGFCESCRRERAKFTVCRASRSGRREERNLCETCAKDSERILFGDRGFLLTDLLQATALDQSTAEEGGDRTKVCPGCGNAASKVSEAGVVGCAMCYVVFRDEIAHVIAKLHDYSPGRGKPA